MKTKFCFTLFISILFLNTLFSNDLKIQNLAFDENTSILTFDLGWENAWRLGNKFRDAAYVFAKYKEAGGQWKHVRLSLISAPADMETSPHDDMGHLVFMRFDGQGSVKLAQYKFLAQVYDQNQNLINIGQNFPFPDFKVFSVEMVYIPEGPFYWGGYASSPNHDFFHRGDDQHEGVLITSESQQINYGSGSNEYRRENSTTGPTILPQKVKGYDEFYCMKYEITQQQYADFLNTLTVTQQPGGYNIYPLVLNDTPQFRNGIIDLGITNEGRYEFGCDLNGNGIPGEADDGQNIACNMIQPHRVAAYLDWAGMQPIGDIMLFKICRGPNKPVDDEFAWGSPFYNEVLESKLTDIGTGSERQLDPQAYPFAEFPVRAGYAATASSNQFFAGATYYGVMEMSGSLGETISYASGEVLPGDGELSVEGEGQFSAIFNQMCNPDSRLSDISRGTECLVQSTGGRGIVR
ncbi:hypothetical protein [Portibacter marinus]|uniref:hypothetical protein n=1 Tax=Portibacter marinus TaxID=2898660 RepID=UPI001F3FA630|nr:hypothetical protein [Portibacter marinus]